ncbi:hypothetical protein D3C76_1285640 [compost metagenome]
MVDTVGILHSAGGGTLIGAWVSRVECSHGRRSAVVVHLERDRGRRRVQVDALVDQRGGLGLQRRGIDLQVGQHTFLDLAGGVCHIALQTQTIGGDHEVVLVRLEGTRTRIDTGAIVGQHEEALPLDTHVQHITGGVDVALLELLGNGRQTHAITHLVLAHAQTVGTRIYVREFGTR